MPREYPKSVKSELDEILERQIIAKAEFDHEFVTAAVLAFYGESSAKQLWWRVINWWES